jgi:RNA polymerase sigma factor (sigma-70 family)
VFWTSPTAAPAVAPRPTLHFRSAILTKMEDCYMAEIKNPEGYFTEMVQNSYKNEYRSNDNFFNHISSVGDETDIQEAHRTGKKTPKVGQVEDSLVESSVENWLLLMESERLHRALSRLKQKDIQCLYLMFVQRYTNIELGDHFGLKPNTIAKWKQRLIDNLKKYF